MQMSSRSAGVDPSPVYSPTAATSDAGGDLDPEPGTLADYLSPEYQTSQKSKDLKARYVEMMAAIDSSWAGKAKHMAGSGERPRVPDKGRYPI